VNEIDRIQQAIQRARAAQDLEAVAELEGLLAQARTQAALQAPAFNAQQGFKLEPMAQEDITRNRERYFAIQAKERADIAASEQVGLTDIGRSGLSGTVEAAPSGVTGATQLGAGAYLGEARDTAQGMIRTDPGTVEGLTRTIQGVSNPFSTLVGMFTPEKAPEQLQQAGQANLEETLAIRKRNAEEIEKLKQAYVAEGGSEFAADVAAGVGGSLTSVAPLAGAAIVGGVTRSPAAAMIAQRTLAILPATQAYADSYAEYRAKYPDASEADAQKYAMSMASIEFGVESMIPGGAGGLAGTGLKQATGAVASRTAREGLTEGVTEITSQVAQRELAPALAPQTPEEALYNVGLATTAGTVLGGPINTVGVATERAGLTRAQRVEQQRLAELASRDETGKVAEGAAVVAQAEQAASAREPFREMEQTALSFPEREPTIKDMFSGEETPALAPEQRNLGMTEDLAAAQKDLDSIVTRDREIRDQIAEIESKPAGDSGKLSRSQRTRIKTLREQANNLGIQAEVARARVLEARAAPEAAIPSSLTPEEARTAYLREMQSRQFDQVERERLGEMGGLGAAETGAVFQPTKPRIRVEPEPVQESLPLPKPRIRVGEDLTQQPVPNEVSRRNWQEGPTMEMDLRVPEVPVTEAPVSPVQGTLDLPAPTPLPTTRASRVEAPTQPPAAPIVREDVIDLETGRVTGEQTAEVGVPVNDTQRRQLEDFFTNVKANRSVNLPSDQQAAFARIMNVQVPPEQRKATPLRQALSRARTAWDALAGVKAAVRMGADPKIERYDRLIDSLTTEDMKNVGFTLLQPETEARTPFQRALKDDPKELQTKGSHEVDPATGRDEVTIVGDGYARRDGTATVETTLHEIVHAKGAAAIRAVQEGRETDPAIVQAVRDLEAVRTTLKDSIPKSGLTADEKSAVSYAVSNTDEFVTGVMTNPLVQSALKKENLWDKVRNIIRALLRIPRSQKSLLDEVLDASYSLVDAINKRDAGTRREVTTPDTGARRATVQTTRASRVNEAREQSVGKPTKLRPMPRTDIGRRLDRVGRFLHDWLSANKRGTDETTEAFSKAQGAIQRAHAELQPVGLKLDRLLSGISRRRSDAKAELATKYLSTNDAKEKASIAEKLKYPELVQTLDRARAIMDRVSTDVGREIVKAYEGRTMPESVTNLLQTIKKNLGQYTARVYLADIEDGYASRLWESYKKGDPAAREQLQPLVNKVDGQLNKLASWIQGAKDEAALLSDDRVDFNATDTILGKEIRNRYSNFLGNPGNKPLKELFKELEAFSSSVEKSDLANERDRAVQKLIGVFDDAAQGDALVQYARAMRSDEKATLRRQNVPPELRKAWGEIVDPILLFNVTTARAVAAMANLRSSNYLMDNAPNLFSTREEPETNKMARIPNNPSVYGKMAGMYTIPAVHDAVVAQTAMLGAKGVGNDVTGWLSDGFQKALQGARTVTRWTKLTQIVTNVFNGTILNSLNLVYMPLINGNISPARLKDAFLAAQSLVATAYRTGDPHPRALELLDEGVIDPVQLSTDEEVRARTREARLIEQGAGATRTAARQVLDAGFTNPLNTLKEVVNFFELLPKAWNYYNAKDEFRAAFPDLSEAEIRNLAAEQTNQMNPTYARTRMAVQATETTMVSYTANYMEQIATNTAMAIKVGYTQAANGIRTGNKQLAYMGIKKLMGVSGAMGASYMLPSIVGAALGVVEDDEDQIIAENLPFFENGMQPVIVGVDGDRVVFMDAGRANPGDTVHAPLRAFISAIANIEDGNTEEAARDLEGGVNNLKGQFFGGSMLGTIALSFLQDRRTGQQLERGLPEVYTWLAENAPAPAATTNIANAAYSALVPAQAKGVAESYTRRQKQGDEFNWDTREVLTALRAPVRDASMIDSVSTSARTFQEARRSPSSDLRQVILAPGDISDERFNQLVDDLIESQQEPYNEMLRSLEGIRALGRKQNLSSSETDKMLREGLKAGNIAARDMDAILRGEPFKPKQLSDTFLEDAIANRVRSEQVRQERARLQTLYESRVERVKEIMDDRIKNYNQ
jgi:hypothetical protein